MDDNIYYKNKWDNIIDKKLYLKKIELSLKEIEDRKWVIDICKEANATDQ